MSTKNNLHRETLRTALRIIQTSETLEQAASSSRSCSTSSSKLESQGVQGDAAVAEAETADDHPQVPKTTAADQRWSSPGAGKAGRRGSPHLTFYRIDQGQVVERAIDEHPVPDARLRMTERHAIFFDTPAVGMVCRVGLRRPAVPRWQEGAGARESASCRSAGGRVRKPGWFDVPACQVTHTANAFEQDDRIVVDEDPHRPLPVGRSRPTRRPSIDGGSTSRGVDGGTDRPTVPSRVAAVDERRVGRPYRHAYVVEYRDVGPANLPRKCSNCALRRRDRQVVHEDPGKPAYPARTRIRPGNRRDAAEDLTGGCSVPLRPPSQDRTNLVVLGENEFGGDQWPSCPCRRERSPATSTGAGWQTDDVAVGGVIRFRIHQYGGEESAPFSERL